MKKQALKAYRIETNKVVAAIRITMSRTILLSMSPTHFASISDSNLQSLNLSRLTNERFADRRRRLSQGHRLRASIVDPVEQELERPVRLASKSDLRPE